jgi:hypothetical protein
MSNIINKIVANVKQTSETTNNYINSNNIVCIDTSNNRIGINTKYPRYSIDVSNSSSLNNENITIFTPILETISGIITNIDSSNISCNNQITSTNLTVTNNTVLSNLAIGSIDFSNQTTTSQSIILEIGSNNDLSTNKFFINEISSNIIDSSNIISQSIILNGDLSYNPGGNPLDIYCRKLIGNIEPQNITTQQVNATTISGDSLTITSDVSFFSNVFISGEISCNFIKVTTISADSIILTNQIEAIKFQGQNADFSYIHTISLEFVDTISGKTLKLLNTEISNNIITTNISANHLFINDILIDNSIQFNPNTINSDFSNRNTMDISQGRCILPNVISDDISKTIGFMGEIIFTTDNQVLNIWDGSQYKQLVLGNDFANFKLDPDISGNNINYDTINGNSIDNSNNLLIGDSNDFKLIPIIFDSSANNSNFRISSYSNSDLPGLIDITDSEFNNKLIEVNANISLRFINKVPGDVEACTYEFILFDSSSNLLNDVNVNNDKSLVSIKNSMLVIDNSFNFSNSNLTYILNNIQTKYLYFCISTNSKQNLETNLNYLSIDSFHCSIKTI